MKNGKLSDENVRIDREFKKVIGDEMWTFEKLFYSDYHKKLFIKLSMVSQTKYVVVFDMKNDFFYSHRNFLTSNPCYKEKRVFAPCRDGSNVGVYYSEGAKTTRSEIRTLKFDDDELVDGGVKLKIVEKNYFFERYLWSACYV